ncbi:MAG: toll/interleukin-1 receptor domain-containing protein [Acidobacteriota bacterium]
MQTKVFISYATEDSEVARQIYQLLEQNGLEPWIDREELLAGQQWKDEIIKAIQDAAIVVPIFSSHALTKRGFFQKELKAAYEAMEEVPGGQIFIIPVRIDDCAIPDRLQGIQWIDWFKDPPKGAAALVRSIRLQLESLGKTRTRQHDESGDAKATDSDVPTSHGVDLSTLFDEYDSKWIGILDEIYGGLNRYSHRTEERMQKIEDHWQALQDSKPFTDKIMSHMLELVATAPSNEGNEQPNTMFIGTLKGERLGDEHVEPILRILDGFAKSSYEHMEARYGRSPMGYSLWNSFAQLVRAQRFSSKDRDRIREKFHQLSRSSAGMRALYEYDGSYGDLFGGR